jgi:hypothetical protein
MTDVRTVRLTGSIPRNPSMLVARRLRSAAFVRPLMGAVGLDGGRSRLPSRDAAVTPEIRAGFERCLLAAAERSRGYHQIDTDPRVPASREGAQ